MKVKFLHHSTFCVEMSDKVMVFDYCTQDCTPGFHFTGVMPEYEKDTAIYVFSSHQHRDHFSGEVLQWAKKYPKIQYVFPKEINLSERFLRRWDLDESIKERVHYVKSNDNLELDQIEIKTLVSTDEGVAFFVSYQGENFYHAGDLNWWHWEGAEEIVNEYQKKTYKRQVDKLKDIPIDAACVVIDQRLEAAKYWGIDYFMEQVNAKCVFPMHLWQNFKLIEEYKKMPHTIDYRDRIMDITEENQAFFL